ncbi:MAG TPA: hypothetical protein VFP05_04075 [Thermomicrobiales bacterium]|nr:hypothetical protein [Thermomicrobiales bacterium]
MLFGQSFFDRCRLARFALDLWTLLGDWELVDWRTPAHPAWPIVDVSTQGDHVGLRRRIA